VSLTSFCLARYYSYLSSRCHVSTKVSQNCLNLPRQTSPPKHLLRTPSVSHNIGTEYHKYARVFITTNQRGPFTARPHLASHKMSVAPMLSMSTNTSSASLARHLDNPVPLPSLGLDNPVLTTSFGLDNPVLPTSYGLDNSIPQPILDLDISIEFDNDTAAPTTRSNTPQPSSEDINDDDDKNKNKIIVLIGPVSAGTIAQRRALTRAIRSFAQRQLKTQFSTTSLSHRLEQQRESSRSRQRSPSRSRDLQLQRSHEGSAIAMRRCQNRVLRSKRRASSRLGHGHSLAPPGQTAGGHGQRVLVKKASKIGSEMMFFGEFKANPGRQWFNGCVVS
jgi:hypothetical protein